ncbi:MAG: hypothetical protein K0S79_2373 [Nitrospira sp.]|nr:hypothetical protein [Nitrospira sp.]MDF2459957.1 hypothetical protein [Nitrospira sp.]
MGIDELHFSLDGRQKTRDIHLCSGERALEFGPPQDGFQFREGISAHDGDEAALQDGLNDPCRRPCGGQQTGHEDIRIKNDAHARAEPLQLQRQSVRG